MFKSSFKLCKQGILGVRYFFHKPYAYTPTFGSSYPATNTSVLDNGVRVVSENWEVANCTVGLWIDVGTRCENEKTSGTAKFLEHMYFKGTANKDHNTIQNEVSTRYASLGAFTSRETIAIYVRCLKEDVDWAVSLLGEIVGAPKYTDEVFEREKKSVLLELENSENDYKSIVFDYMHAAGYQETPLAGSVHGLEENIKNMTIEDLYNFNKSFFKAPKMVLVAVGDVEHTDLFDSAKKHLNGISCNYENGIDERKQCRFVGSEIRDRDDALPLAHIAIAFQGPASCDVDTIDMRLAAAINGTFDRTHGHTKFSASHYARKLSKNPHLSNFYSFENFYIQYHDTSLWGLYFTSNGSKLWPHIDDLKSIFVRTCTNITELEVNRAKNQFLTNIMMSFDDTLNVCHQIGQDTIWLDRRLPINELVQRVVKVKPDDIRETLSKYIYNRCPVVVGYGPIEGLPPHPETRTYSRWFRF